MSNFKYLYNNETDNLIGLIYESWYNSHLRYYFKLVHYSLSFVCTRATTTDDDEANLLFQQKVPFSLKWFCYGEEKWKAFCRNFAYLNTTSLPLLVVLKARWEYYMIIVNVWGTTETPFKKNNAWSAVKMQWFGCLAFWLLMCQSWSHTSDCSYIISLGIERKPHSNQKYIKRARCKSIQSVAVILLIAESVAVPVQIGTIISISFKKPQALLYACQRHEQQWRTAWSQQISKAYMPSLLRQRG